MFLGIDRRSVLGLGRSAIATSRQARFGRNIFSRSLGASLAAAATLAENRYRDALIQSGRLGERLQREMLLELLGAGAHRPNKISRALLPSDDDLKEVFRVRRDMKSISDILKLPLDEVKTRLDPILDLLESSAQQINKNFPISNQNKIDRSRIMSKVSNFDENNMELVSAIANWSANQPHLQRVKVISDKVAIYNVERNTITADAEKYKLLINSFLKDSGKEIVFGDDGYIGVSIAGIDRARPISSLSSVKRKYLLYLRILHSIRMLKKIMSL